MRFPSLRISGRIYLVVAITTAVIIGVAWEGVRSIDRFQQQALVTESVARQTQYGERLNALVYAVVMDSRGIYMSESLDAAKPFAAGIQRFTAEMENVIRLWSDELGPDAIATPEAQKFLALVNEFIRFRRELARLGTEVDVVQARAYGDNDENRANRRALNAAIGTVTDTNAARIVAVNRDLAAFYESQRPMMIATAAVGLGVSLLLAVLIVVITITRPITRITALMNRLAGGDLAVEVVGAERRDEIGAMAKTVQVFKENMVARADAEQQIAAQHQEETRQREAREARERAAIAEISDLCDRIAAGDLDKRLDETGKEGFLLTMSQRLNGLADMLQGMARELADSSGRMGQGDLTCKVTGSYGGVFGRLKDGVNTMADTLQDFASRLRTSAAAVRDASAEISAGSQDLAQRTESQAASIEETAASMHEITTTVKQNADNAQAASQLAVVARDTAETGGNVVQDAVAAVSRIEDSAQKIADIVGLIDEIAFQTNLLALNASVEAARAGEAGKGFAVVAQEVRALAQRSANASKDIKALIGESNTQVKTGASLVNRTGESLREIVTAVKKVSDIVAEIAAASREQATGLEQINTAVGGMDEMTQRNGALVEETSASAQALAGQAEELARLVAFFRTDATAERHSVDVAAMPIRAAAAA